LNRKRTPIDPASTKADGGVGHRTEKAPCPRGNLAQARWRMEEEKQNNLILKGIEIITGEDKEQVKTLEKLANKTLDARAAFASAHNELIAFVEQGE
jgi:hypothetical protein